MEKAEVLAERRVAVERDGVAGLQEAALQIGYPQWSKGGDEAVCSIAITSVFEDLPPACGRDFFAALVDAARRVRQHCRNLPQGTRLFYLGDPPYDREPYTGEPIDQEDWEAERRRLEALRRKDWSVLVTRKILMQKDGEEQRSELVLQIGHPYWMIEGEMAACPVAMKGVDIDWAEHREGRDLFEALSHAVAHINEYFESPQCGRFYFWPDGEPYGGDFGHLPPRRYERDPRAIPGSWQALAERTLLMARNGELKRRRIVVKVGHPYWVEHGKEAACPIDIVGLINGIGPLHGDDLYTALIFALEFFDRHIRTADPDTHYFWPDGTPYAGEPLDRAPESGN